MTTNTFRPVGIQRLSICLLLSATLVVTNIQPFVRADTKDQSTTRTTLTDGPEQGRDLNLVNPFDGDESNNLGIDKRIVSFDTKTGEATIELTVQGSVTEMATKQPINVILVIDQSESMFNDDAEVSGTLSSKYVLADNGDGDYLNENGEPGELGKSPYKRVFTIGDDGAKTTKRIESVKWTAKNIINSVLGSDNPVREENKVAVVSFARYAFFHGMDGTDFNANISSVWKDYNDLYNLLADGSGSVDMMYHYKSTVANYNPNNDNDWNKNRRGEATTVKNTGSLVGDFVNQGTNVQAGLLSAYHALSNLQGGNDAPTYVILLSDGLPIYSFTSDNAADFPPTDGGVPAQTEIWNGDKYGSVMWYQKFERNADEPTVNIFEQYKSYQRAIAAAQLIKNKGATIIAVGVDMPSDSSGLPPYATENTAVNFLRDISSAEQGNNYYFNASAKELQNIIIEISETISKVSAGTDVVVEDILGEHFTLSDNSEIETTVGNATIEEGKIIWDWKDAHLDDRVQTLTYKVALDPEAPAGEHFTNDVATINFNNPDGKKMVGEFPKPSVYKYTFDATKTVEAGETTVYPENTLFEINAEITPTAEGNGKGSLQLKAGETGNFEMLSLNPAEYNVKITEKNSAGYELADISSNEQGGHYDKNEKAFVMESITFPTDGEKITVEVTNQVITGGIQITKLINGTLSIPNKPVRVSGNSEMEVSLYVSTTNSVPIKNIVIEDLVEGSVGSRNVTELSGYTAVLSRDGALTDWESSDKILCEGDSLSVKYKLPAPLPDETHHNTASVSGVYTGSSGEELPVTAFSDAYAVNPRGEIQIEKFINDLESNELNPVPVAEGSQMKITVKVTNPSDVVVTDLVVTDLIAGNEEKEINGDNFPGLITEINRSTTPEALITENTTTPAALAPEADSKGQAQEFDGALHPGDVLTYTYYIEAASSGKPHHDTVTAKGSYLDGNGKKCPVENKADAYADNGGGIEIRKLINGLETGKDNPATVTPDSKATVTLVVNTINTMPVSDVVVKDLVHGAGNTAKILNKTNFPDLVTTVYRKSTDTTEDSFNKILYGGDVLQYTYTVDIPSGKELPTNEAWLHNTATATGTTKDENGNEVLTEHKSDGYTLLNLSGGIKITKLINNLESTLSNPVTVTAPANTSVNNLPDLTVKLIVETTTPIPITDVKVTDLISGGAEKVLGVDSFDNYSLSVYRAATSSKVASFDGTLNYGDILEYTFTVPATQAGALHHNVATVTAGYLDSKGEKIKVTSTDEGYARTVYGIRQGLTTPNESGSSSGTSEWNYPITKPAAADGGNSTDNEPTAYETPETKPIIHQSTINDSLVLPLGQPNEFTEKTADETSEPNSPAPIPKENPKTGDSPYRPIYSLAAGIGTTGLLAALRLRRLAFKNKVH